MNRPRGQPRARIVPKKTARDLWRVVDGAVKMAFDAHPDYLSASRALDIRTVRNSIVKRVVGSLLSSRKGGANRDKPRRS